MSIFSIKSSEQGKCVPPSLLGLQGSLQNHINLLNKSQLLSLKYAIQQLLGSIKTKVTLMTKQAVAVGKNNSRILANKTSISSANATLDAGVINSVKDQTNLLSKYSPADINTAASKLSLSPTEFTSNMKKSQQVFSDVFNDLQDTKKSLTLKSSFSDLHANYITKQQEQLHQRINNLKETRQKMTSIFEDIDKRLKNV